MNYNFINAIEHIEEVMFESFTNLKRWKRVICGQTAESIQFNSQSVNHYTYNETIWSAVEKGNVKNMKKFIIFYFSLNWIRMEWNFDWKNYGNGFYMIFLLIQMHA